MIFKEEKKIGDGGYTEKNFTSELNNKVLSNDSAKHTHNNKSTIDKFGEDANGLPTFNGNSIDTTIAQRDVYDGLNSDDSTISLSAKQGKILDSTKVNKIAGKELSDNNLTDSLVSIIESALQSHQDISYKVDKVDGKELSDNNLTDDLLAAITSTSQSSLSVNVLATYGSSDQSDLTWDDANGAIKNLSLNGNESTGMAFPVFEVNTQDGEYFNISLFIKGDQNVSGGLFIRIYEYNSILPDGKTHISNRATHLQVQEDTSGVNNWVENSAITTNWKQYTYEYTPTPEAKYASIVVLNWLGNSNHPLWVKEPIIQKNTSKVTSHIKSNELLVTGSSKRIDAETTTVNAIGYTNGGGAADMYGVGDGGLFNQAYDKDWQGQIFIDYRTGKLASRGQSGGVWHPWNKIWSSNNDGAGSGLDADLVEGKSVKHRVFLNNHFKSATGGGTLSYSVDYYFKWSDRFILIANGESATTATGGHHNITIPAVGTVIHGIGSQSDVTVTSAGIKLGDWYSLWYEVPIGGGITSLDNNFHICHYSKFNGFEIPENWILIATGNGDGNSGNPLKICTGKTIVLDTVNYPDTSWIYPAFLDGWTNDSAPYGNTRYRRINNIVTLEGIVRSGSVGYNKKIFNLPAGFRPRSKLINAITSGGGLGRLDIDTSGNVIPHSGSSSWFCVMCTFVAHN